jgi:FkbM family methyltransferase
MLRTGWLILRSEHNEDFSFFEKFPKLIGTPAAGLASATRSELPCEGCIQPGSVLIAIPTDMNTTLKKYIRQLLPRSIGPRRILGGPLRGQSLVTSWHDYPAAILGRTEGPLLEWFANNVRPRETWLDVGAHYGYTAVALARLVGPEGRVFAFEPMTSTAGCIARTRSINGLSQLTIVPVALGDCDNVATRELPEVRGMIDSTIIGSGRGEAFFVANFDWLWPRISQSGCGEAPKVDGIKIDVQGMEIETLKGMFETLRRYRPKLVVELHKGVSRQEFFGLIDSAGYSRQGIPVENTADATEYFDDRSYAFSPA